MRTERSAPLSGHGQKMLLKWHGERFWKKHPGRAFTYFQPLRGYTMLQPIKIIMIVVCTMLPVINESRSFAESSGRKKSFKSGVLEASKGSARRKSRSARNDEKRSQRRVTRKVNRPKSSPKTRRSSLKSRSVRNDGKASRREVTRKASRPKVSPKTKARGKLKSLTAKPRRDHGKRPVVKLPIVNPPTGKLPIVKPPTGKLPIVNPPTGKLPIVNPPTGKLPIVNPPTGKLPIDKLPFGSRKPNIGLDRFKDVLRDRVGRKPDLRKKVDWKDLRGGLSRIRDRSSYHVGTGLSKHYRRSRRMALRNLTLGSHCHWWLDFVIGYCWNMHHCHWWDYCVTPGYWDCWTPCHFRVIHCPPSAGIVATSWYFGIDCILIPDLSAYGIQEVDAGSPADMAGLVVGDMIVGINGNPITSEFDLSEAITVSDGHLHLDVIRDGADSSVEIHVDLARLAVRSY